VFSRLALTLNAFLPAVFYLHQGVELGETFPVNTGLGFSPEEISQLPSGRLPLFSESALCWDNTAELTEHVSELNRVRAVWESVVTDPRTGAFNIRNTSDERAVCYVRSSPEKSLALAVLANLDCFNSVRTSVELPTGKTELREELTGAVIRVENGVTTVDLKPGEAMVLPLTDTPARSDA